MTHHRYTRQCSRSFETSALALGCLATLATTGCIRAQEEHCIFNGGDSSINDTTMACLVRSAESQTQLVDKRGRYELPDGTRIDLNGMADMDVMLSEADISPDAYMWMPFGLPESYEGETGDLRSVKGAFAAIATERSLDAMSCTLDDEAVKSLWEKVASSLDTLDSKTNVKLDASTLRDADVRAFNDELLKALATCESSTSETTTDSTSTGLDETATDSSGTSSTTGEEPCVDDDDCRMRDPSLPFCDPSTMMCVDDCSGVPEGACAELDPLVPLCVEGACVACVEGNTAACDEQLLVCDAEQRACVPCSAHDQCEARACDLLAETPTCFEPENVLDVGEGQTYETIGAALTAVEMMMLDRAVLRLHDGMDFNEAATLDGQVIAFIAAPGDSPQWIWSMGSTPTLTVTGVTSRVYLDQLRLVQNASDMDAGLNCDGGAVHVQRSHIVQNDGGGISASNGCVLLLENSFVQGDDDVDPALTMTGSTVTAVYTTFYNSSFASTPAVACDEPSTVTLRNSIVVTEGGAPGAELDCVFEEMVDEVSFTAMEGMVPGRSNVAVGAFPDGMAMQWFTNANIGDFHLQNEGLDVFADIAQWSTGDPLTDIDGDPRPMVDMTRDYPGADVP